MADEVVNLKVKVSIVADITWRDALKLRLAGARYIGQFIQAQIEKLEKADIA